MSDQGIDLNRTPTVGQSSPTGPKKQRRISAADMPPPANMFDGMTGELPPGTKMVKLLPISCNCFPLLFGPGGLSRLLCTHECEDMNGKAIMQDMIYKGANEEEGDYTEYDDIQYEDVHEGYSIDEQPLFANDGYTQGMGNIVTQDMAREITQATEATLVASLAATLAVGKKVSQRTASYIVEEDMMLCSAWIEIPRYPLYGAEQKGNACWIRLGKYFHDHRLLVEKTFYSKHKDLSLAKRWSLIHVECNRFQGSYETVTERKISGVSSIDIPLPLFSMFVAHMREYIVVCCQCV
jgi:hypothetical protein